MNPESGKPASAGEKGRAGSRGGVPGGAGPDPGVEGDLLEGGAGKR